MCKQELGRCKAAGIRVGVAGAGSKKCDLHATWGGILALEPTGQVPPLGSETGMSAMIFGEPKAAWPNHFKLGRLVIRAALSQGQGMRGSPNQRRGLH